MTADLHLAETFRQAESSHPDLMEPYAVLLVEAEGVEDRVSIMRRGLRETIAGRFPLAEAHSTNPQGRLALEAAR